MGVVDEIYAPSDMPAKGMLFGVMMLAKLCHEVNRAYCRGMGDDSQLPWEEAPKWQRLSAIQGVRRVMLDPEVTAESLHEAWCADKRAGGWSYGHVKDAGRLRHPCLVSWDNLPREQRTKDELFIATVRNALDLTL